MRTAILTFASNDNMIAVDGVTKYDFGHIADVRERLKIIFDFVNNNSFERYVVLYGDYFISNESAHLSNSGICISVSDDTGISIPCYSFSNSSFIDEYSKFVDYIFARADYYAMIYDCDINESFILDMYREFYNNDTISVRVLELPRSCLLGVTDTGVLIRDRFADTHELSNSLELFFQG